MTLHPKMIFFNYLCILEAKSVMNVLLTLISQNELLKMGQMYKLQVFALF